MNDVSNTQNSSGLLKNAYPGKIAEMNRDLPMMQVLRQKRDAIKTAGSVGPTL